MAKTSTRDFEEFSFAEGLDFDTEMALEIQTGLYEPDEPGSRVETIGHNKWKVRGDQADLILVTPAARDGFYRYLSSHADGFCDLAAKAGFKRVVSRND